MKTKMYSFSPLLLIAVITAASCFYGKYSGQLMADLKCILAPGTMQIQNKKTDTMQSYITAYKKELKEIRDRDMGGQSTSYPPGSDPELSMQLELAGLHVKYNDLISDKGYNWTELYRLMCAADDSRVNDTICHNIEK